MVLKAYFNLSTSLFIKLALFILLLFGVCTSSIFEQKQLTASRRNNYYTKLFNTCIVILSRVKNDLFLSEPGLNRLKD